MSKPDRVDRAALLKGRRSKTETGTVNPLLPAEPAVPDPFVPAPVDPATVTGSDEERLAAFEAAMAAAQNVAEESLGKARARFVIEAGAALRAIRDDPGKLYAAYGTFEDYIVKRWQMDRSRAYQLIDAAAPMIVMSKIFDVPPVESQARVLAPVLEDHGEDAVRETVVVVRTSGDKVTAATLKAAAVRLGYITVVPQQTARQNTDRPTGDLPEQSRAIIRLEQALSALRAAHKALKGEIVPEAVAADAERGGELAAQAIDLAGKIERLARRR